MEKASKTVFVVIATHNPPLVSTLWDKVGDVRTYYVYRGARGATTVAEVDVERLAREVKPPEDIMSTPPSEVISRYSKEGRAS